MLVCLKESIHIMPNYQFFPHEPAHKLDIHGSMLHFQRRPYVLALLPNCIIRSHHIRRKGLKCRSPLKMNLPFFPQMLSCRTNASPYLPLPMACFNYKITPRRTEMFGFRKFMQIPAFSWFNISQTYAEMTSYSC